MAAPTGFPSYAYNRTQPAVIVQTLDAFHALPPPGVWSATPFAANPPLRPPSESPGTVLEAVLLIYALLLAQVPPTPPAALVAPAAPEPEPEPEHKTGRRPARSGD